MAKRSDSYVQNSQNQNKKADLPQR